MPEKSRKPKAVQYELIGRDDNPKLYSLLDDLVRQHHQPLIPANIALIWRRGWKPNRDGQLVFGKAKKASDLNKEFAEYDLLILLNRDAWHDINSDVERAIIDHELCHFAPDLDKETEQQKEDDRGRLCWRYRYHDLEEFTEIVERHGLYRKELQRLVEAGQRKRSEPLFESPAESA